VSDARLLPRCCFVRKPKEAFPINFCDGRAQLRDPEDYWQAFGRAGGLKGL
jgi:hypothetical protein